MAELALIALHTLLTPNHELGHEAMHETFPSDVATALTQYGVQDWRAGAGVPLLWSLAGPLRASR